MKNNKDFYQIDLKSYEKIYTFKINENGYGKKLANRQRSKNEKIINN